MVAIKKQVDTSQESMLQLSAVQKIKNIKDFLEKSEEFMDDNEKQAICKKHFELSMQCIKDGDGCVGALKSHLIL
jgi:hypothetical protein